MRFICSVLNGSKTGWEGIFLSVCGIHFSVGYHGDPTRRIQCEPRAGIGLEEGINIKMVEAKCKLMYLCNCASVNIF